MRAIFCALDCTRALRHHYISTGGKEITLELRVGIVKLVVDPPVRKGIVRLVSIILSPAGFQQQGQVNRLTRSAGQ